MKLDATLVVDARRLSDAGKIARAAEAVGFAALWTPETQHNPFFRWFWQPTIPPRFSWEQRWLSRLRAARW